MSELKVAEEASKKVTGDVARLTEELRNEQHHHDHLERQKRGLESQLNVLMRERGNNPIKLFC